MPTVDPIDLTAGDDSIDDDDAVPPVYQAALRLEEAGLTPHQIGERLDIAVESVPLLLDLARRKRARGFAVEQTKG